MAVQPGTEHLLVPSAHRRHKPRRPVLAFLVQPSLEHSCAGPSAHRRHNPRRPVAATFVQPGVEQSGKPDVRGLRLKLAAIRGDAFSRHNLGKCEEMRGNFDRSIKHHTIATRLGDAESLDKIQTYFMSRLATKDDYKKALSNYQEYLGEIKSDQRDEAALFDERMNRYY